MLKIVLGKGNRMCKDLGVRDRILGSCKCFSMFGLVVELR